MQSFLERAEKAIATVYQSLKKYGDKVSPTVNKQVIHILEEPPPIFLTHLPWTVFTSERINEVVTATSISAATTIKAFYRDRLVPFLILFSALKEAPDRVLNSALLHELVHIAGWLDEETPRMFVREMSRVDPEHFASYEECVQFLDSWASSASAVLISKKSFERYMDTRPEMFSILLFRNGKLLPSVFVLKLRH